MKKLLSMLLAVFMILSCFSCVAFAQDEIKVVINGKNLTMDQAPVIVNDRTLVPLRAIFEGLGANVEWDDVAKTATGTKDGKEIKITIDQTTAYVDGSAVELDVPAQLISDRTMVPVRFISENLGEKVEWDGNTKTVTITSEAEENIITFDDLTSFASGTDYELGGGLKADGVSISSDFDNTSGSGKSLKVGGRSISYNRVKFKNLIPESYVGKEVTASAYVYYPDMDSNIRVGSYSATGGTFSGTAAYSEIFDIPKNTWTKVEITFVHQEASATMLGFDQPDDKKGLVPVMYIDDVSVLVTNENANKFEIVDMTNHRPVPTEFTKSSDPYDLIYYEVRDIKDIIPTLPKGETILSNEEFLNGKAKGGDKIAFEIVNVEGQEFDKAVRITSKEKTPNIYDVQYEVELTRNFEPGDMGMLVVSSRMISGGNNDTNTGGVQFVIEQNEDPWYKSLQQDGVVNQNEWTKSYMPFNVTEKLGTKVHMTVRVGHYAQVLEIGGVEIINYKDAVTAEELPSTKTYEGMEDGAEWRKEAIERIEKIRKGDFKLVIKDENGNVIPNADIKVNMTEHEFEWGSAVSTPIIAEDDSGKKYRDNLIKYFNSAVLENHLKWYYYEDDPTIPRKIVDTLKAMGIKSIRGHALVWDKTKLSDNGINSSLPDRVLEAAYAKDRDKLQAYVKEHMIKIMAEYKDDLIDWDATNELFRDDTYIRHVFGNDIVVEWFNMANEANVGNAKIYMNEHKMVGTDNYLDKLVPLIEELQAKGAKWDGIGTQAHFAYPCYPPKFYDQLEVLGKYADEIKITEYDFSINDETIHASFTRDFLITIFSHEKVQGFYCWGFKDGGESKYLLFDKNWNRKKAADQYEDLVYNKWWTKEAGTTNANGEFDVRAFYGNYDITVNIGGVEKTVNIPMERANEGTVEVVIK